MFARFIGSLEIGGLGKMIDGKRNIYLNITFSLAIMAHLFIMGGLQFSHKDWTIYPGAWIRPHLWAGMMPPISLLAFLALASFLVIFIYTRLKNRPQI